MDGQLRFELFPKQLEAINSTATEILYGGAAGGGKSHLMRIAAITWATAIPGLQIYLFRRERTDLIKTHLDSNSGFRVLLAIWVNEGLVHINEDGITFWNGSKIYLCHCQHEKDLSKYLSAEIHCLLMDEGTTFTGNMYRRLRARVRMIGVEVPESLKGMFPRILVASNPGNLGHLFFKSEFIDGREPMKIYDETQTSGTYRQYIPARVNDNPALLEQDPHYVNKLKAIGSRALVEAMLNGDWDVVEGAFFDEWSAERHVVKPFKIPDHWARFISGDWGSAKPFSFGWHAIVGDTFVTPCGKTLPRGCLIRYKEWYGSPNHSDVGLKLTAEEVGKGIRERMTEKIDYGVLDPAAFAQDGGPSIAEKIYDGGKIRFTRADNKRVAKQGAIGGWDEVRARLKGDDDGNPMLVVFENCVDLIRTLPAMQHDENRPEDLDTKMEDHAVDELRYACMSRPYAPSVAKNAERALPKGSFRDIISQQSKKRKAKELLNG